MYVRPLMHVFATLFSTITWIWCGGRYGRVHIPSVTDRLVGGGLSDVGQRGRGNVVARLFREDTKPRRRFPYLVSFWLKPRNRRPHLCKKNGPRLAGTRPGTRGARGGHAERYADMRAHTRSRPGEHTERNRHDHKGCGAAGTVTQMQDLNTDEMEFPCAF